MKKSAKPMPFLKNSLKNDFTNQLNLSRVVASKYFSHMPYAYVDVISFWTFSFDMHLRKIFTLSQVFI